MESNRDEAERCLEIGERVLREGRADSAEKFALKAERLFPTQRGRDLLEAARAAPKDAPQHAPADSETRRRRAPSHSETPPRDPEYTRQQLAAVEQVNGCKDYYEVLGVAKDATDSDVKRAYKKLALLLHPDKNKAPGAAEAFKRLGRAAATLTDAEQRKRYDTFGPEDERVASHRTQYRRHSYGRGGFDADFTPEEFFNIFFNSAGAHVYTRRGGRYHRDAYHQNREAQGNYASILQMLPIFGLILLSMMSTFFIQDSIYSISPSNKYPVLRTTENLRIPYYVKENFHNEYQGSLRRLEMSVEEEYIANLRLACQRERTYRDNMAWKARNFDKPSVYNVNNMKLPSCEALSNLHRQI